MSEIKDLQPKAIWKNFYALTRIPRPSGHVEKVQQFLLDFARNIGVEAFLDKAGNVVMRKAATPGMESRKTVTLQAHMDMVPQKTATSSHNFETDPIETYIDGEWVKARGTTLGADDGMGVATIMAVMEATDLKHGPIEGFITVDEETTMYGVNHMEPGTLTGSILLNLDNETEGEMMIGSAGGVNLGQRRARDAGRPARRALGARNRRGPRQRQQAHGTHRHRGHQRVRRLSRLVGRRKHAQRHPARLHRRLHPADR